MVLEATDYTALSRGAFDKTAVQPTQSWEKDLSTFATESFDTGVKGVLKNFGMDELMISKLGSVGSADFVDNMWKVGSQLLSVGVKSVLGDALSTIFEAGKTGYEMFINAGTKRTPSFKEGEWVIIDNGTAPAKELRRRENVLSGASFQQALDISDRRRAFEFEGDRDISAGFYMGLGKEENTVTVFNFRDWKDEDVFITKVNEMPEGEAAKLDADKFVSEIRALKFKQVECKLLNANVPTDPGTEVLLDDERYHVVTSVGQTVTIEDEWGWQSTVDISKLTRGRVTHTQSHNYQPNTGKLTAGFINSGEDAIYAGCWLWVSARDLGYPAGKELVCVQYIHNKVHVFHALDGEKGSFEEDEVALVSDEFKQLFNDNSTFAEFRGFAMAGYDMRRVACGKEYPLLCIGVTGTDEGQTKTPMKEVDACDTVFSRLEKAIGRVGDLDLHKEIDNAEERAAKNEGMVARDNYEGIFEPEPGEEMEPENNGGSGNIIMLVAVAGAAIFLLNSVA